MDSRDPNTQELVQSVLETLTQGEALLALLTDAEYTRRLPVAFNACIGGHYRHCLDHFRSLLEGAAAGKVNYDRRRRGTVIETDRVAAVQATDELRRAYQQLDPTWLTRQLTVTCRTSATTSGSQVSPSSFGREIMYSVAHAVHHYALIGFMAGVMGLDMPAGFGIAPSTLKHQAEASDASVASR